jgi:hypothetical protein
MAILIRKAVDFLEEIYTDGDKAAPRPLKIFLNISLIVAFIFSKILLALILIINQNINII